MIDFFVGTRYQLFTHINWLKTKIHSMSRLKKENKNLKDKYTFIGSLKLVSNLRSADFWALMDELVDDGSGFYNNRCLLLDAWEEGDMHSLAIGEPGDMLNSWLNLMPRFVRAWIGASMPLQSVPILNIVGRLRYTWYSLYL